ncbi:tripartite tricarboxylate transporter TctB family protein [Brucella gallinifaecis]|uniref:Tripartite tricarboxylate transporter TctB family protein n=1 Tax=Brucella gallinifaecis TaxID=215590 RepID=A0A502BHV9_9HYPH|nr:tripartite tricarboxylate transporter TctB family protein [Brucella gallinifaecis]TPF73910.1 tripartite tricarboxylate transporter TctB family protein [Brucella gallinifaecis]
MTQRLLGAAFALFGVAVLLLAMQLPAPLAGTRIAYGPGFFPILLSIIIITAGAWLAVIGPGSAVDEVEGERYSLRAFAKPAVVCIAALIYIFYSQQIGFLILAPIILITLLLLGNVSLVPSIVIGLVAAITVHIVFAKILLVPLPLGLLSQWGRYL